jgi:hypothetical protein
MTWRIPSKIRTGPHTGETAELGSKVELSDGSLILARCVYGNDSYADMIAGEAMGIAGAFIRYSIELLSNHLPR